MTAEERVARLLCGWAEYHEANWRMYLPRAREIIAALAAEPAPATVAPERQP
jgi:hypothetical protein